ncbi:hypothetical protein BDB00DRAFT_857963 [Zychaea mexicana]|uniref:uncharacterized protein n=1 Tax=Zychaea mexicana TaxID=64656 RepID=UPI0022FF3147|nr:uncharacterized protein BDB00DRAFT_857963 [Zychaea mexicana]KAI9480246.1 hypothetical protein BDB00DRAFT_857963 [Zychaea mexicana]
MRTSFTTLTVATILALSAIADAAPGALKIMARDDSLPGGLSVKSIGEGGGVVASVEKTLGGGPKQGAGATDGSQSDGHNPETPTHDGDASPESPETPATPHHSDPNTT